MTVFTLLFCPDTWVLHTSSRCVLPLTNHKNSLLILQMGIYLQFLLMLLWSLLVSSLTPSSCHSCSNYMTSFAPNFTYFPWKLLNLEPLTPCQELHRIHCGNPGFPRPRIRAWWNPPLLPASCSLKSKPVTPIQVLSLSYLPLLLPSPPHHQSTY